MTKEEKIALVEGLAQKIRNNPNFYLVDLAGLTVEQTNNLRRKCFEHNVELKMVKNTLIRKALEQVGGEYDSIYGELKQSTSILFVGDDVRTPAKMVKAFKADKERPNVKAAFVQESPVTGEKVIDQLINFRGKRELLGEVVGMLQSPMQKVIGALQGGGGQKIAGLVKALEERQGNAA